MEQNPTASCLAQPQALYRRGLTFLLLGWLFQPLPHLLLWSTALLLLSGNNAAKANDIRLSNISLVAQNSVDGHVSIQFDLAWNNAWRLPASLPPANWDAAWVFAKFRVGFVNPSFTVASAGAGESSLSVNTTDGLRVGMPVRITGGTGSLADNSRITAINTTTKIIDISSPTTAALTNAQLEAERIWEHAWLHESGHIVPSGASLQLGLANEGSAFNASSNPGLGVFVYKSNDGQGTFSAAGMRLRWNYEVQGVLDGDILDIRLYAVEMVQQPSGAFVVGSGGGELNSFTAADAASSGAPVPFSIGATAPSLQGNDPGSSANNLGARGAIDLSGTSTATLASGFPTGFDAFYLLKYEISQQQYVDFLNSLSRQQQAARVATDVTAGENSTSNRYVLSGSSSVSNRNGIRCNATFDAYDPLVFYCDLNGNGTSGDAVDGQGIACNYLSWADVAAYLDWAGLRPMTELEYEKAGRAEAAALPDAYAWGSTNISAVSSIINQGQRTETRGNTDANAVYNNLVGGPLRVGGLAGLASSRQLSGAGRNGNTELSGNLWEYCITVGNSTGRDFTGAHGNGSLSPEGAANAPSWPGNDAIGSGLRGGAWDSSEADLRISDRRRAAESIATRNNNQGGRGARSAPSSTPIVGS
jgi:formylglycine-generating enzyme required for sulfatase activity